VANGRIVVVESSRGWAERYEAGLRDQVWHELRQVGASIRADADMAADAQLVCDAMARRARQNIETIVRRLADQNYRFHLNDDDETPVVPHRPPGERAPFVAEWLDAHAGPLPMTVRSWLLLVGDVWLVGAHPRWPESAAADPLVIELEGSKYPNYSIVDYFAAELTAHGDCERDAPFALPFAPDRLHKENVSGGSPYGLLLPDGCADGLIMATTAMPFVAYLNHVFAHGGFPWPTTDQQWAITRSLASGLLPL
jgi:hypothetical protein